MAPQGPGPLGARGEGRGCLGWGGLSGLAGRPAVQALNGGHLEGPGWDRSLGVSTPASAQHPSSLCLEGVPPGSAAQHPVTLCRRQRWDALRGPTPCPALLRADVAGGPCLGPRLAQAYLGEDLVPVSVATALGSGLLGRHTFVPRGGPRTSPELSGMLSCPGRLQGDRRAPSTGRAGRRVVRQQACVGVSTWTQPSLRLSRTPPPRVLQNPNLPPGHSDAVTAEAGCGCLRPRESNLENKVLPL